MAMIRFNETGKNGDLKIENENTADLDEFYEKSFFFYEHNMTIMRGFAYVAYIFPLIIFVCVLNSYISHTQYALV